MVNHWLSEAIQNAQPFYIEPHEIMLINKLIDAIEQLQLSQETRLLALGAAFDLLVAAEYYSTIAHVGWLYCALPTPFLIYPYTNTCPHCLLKNNFTYHKAHKPKSGTIGAATSRLLCQFIKELLSRKGTQVDLLRGREPVDVIFLDNSTQPVTLFFAEIKASPLVTPPLIAKTQTLLMETHTSDDNVVSHREIDFHTLFGSDLFLFLPQTHNKDHQANLYPLGTKQSQLDSSWAYRGLSHLLNDPTFFPTYVSFWREAFAAYQFRDVTMPIYWLTNGCGQPVPRPVDWPQRTGTGYESISDAKTSVGMDRTDDIKKAIYQVLKLGTEGKPSLEYAYKVGVVSNIHAVRHYDEYLSAMKDIVWTRDTTGNATTIADLPPESELFNLFDGIVTLTEVSARDPWVRRVFNL